MKNDPTGKTHETVAKTSSQEARKGTYSANEKQTTGGPSMELLTPRGILGGLRGVARATNKSNGLVGTGDSQGLKLLAGLNADSHARPANRSNAMNVGK